MSMSVVNKLLTMSENINNFDFSWGGFKDLLINLGLITPTSPVFRFLR